MTVVGVASADGPIGRRVLAGLQQERAVSAVVALGTEEPAMPGGRLQFRRADLRDPLLPAALAGVDVLVHVGTRVGPSAGKEEAFARTVSSTRNVLAAATQAGVRHLVHLSSAAVYGAHEGNAVPLDEDAPLRANHDFPWAYQHLLAEELVTSWAAEHPDRPVAVLRPATILAPGVDTAVTRHLEQPVLPVVKGSEPPLQVVSSDDAADALVFAVRARLRGAFNVAADGWLSSAEVARVLGRPRLQLPEAVAFTAAALLWSHRLVAAPPGALHYLMHPWVVSCERLHTLGWRATDSNRDVLRAFAAEHAGWVALGSRRARKRDVALTVASALAGGGAGFVLSGRRAHERRGLGEP